MDKVQEVDIVVVGSGPSACALVASLLASRSDDKSLSIAVLERGPPQSVCPEVKAPAFMFSIVADPSKGVTRMVNTVQPSGRQSPLVTPTGNTLGGGSAVNFMHWSLGGASDYDSWPDGWKFKDLKSHFDKNYTLFAVDQARSLEGPGLQVTDGPPLPMSAGFKEAAQRVGLPVHKNIQDFQTSNGVSRAFRTVNPKTGQRSDAYTALLQPRENSIGLHLLTNCLVSRVLFDSKMHATGCEYVHLGQTLSVQARKLVILAAGALGTPGILERSGIGSPAILRDAGVEKVLVDLPGVGSGHQDHPLCVLPFKAKKGTASISRASYKTPEGAKSALARLLSGEDTQELSHNHADICGKVRPSEQKIPARFGAHALAVEDVLKGRPSRSLYGILTSENAAPTCPENQPGFMVGVVPFHPLARGSLHITTSDPADGGFLDPKLSEHPADTAVLLDALRFADQLARATPFYDGSLGPKSMEEEDLLPYIRETVGTCYHSIGTCAMKPRAESGVVDEHLNVHGTIGLKVADLSICPSHISAVNITFASIFNAGLADLGQIAHQFDGCSRRISGGGNH